MDAWHHTHVKILQSFVGKERRAVWGEFFERIRKASYLSLGASQTGNTTLLRIRVPSGWMTPRRSLVRHELKLETYRLKSENGGNYIIGEILKQFISLPISVLLDYGHPSELIYHSNIGDAFAKPICEEARKRGITFLDDVVKSVFSQKIGAKQDAHQLKRAMEDFEKAVAIALSQGASFSDMEKILQEKAISSVMES